MMSLQPSRIHGTITNRSRINSLIFTETVYPAKFKIANHFHAHACFYLVLEGMCTETFGNTTIEASTNSLLFRPAAEPHSNELGNTPARCFVIELENRWLESQQAYAPLLN